VREGHGVAFRWDKSFKGFGEEAAVNEEAPLGRADTSGLPWRARPGQKGLRPGTRRQAGSDNGGFPVVVDDDEPAPVVGYLDRLRGEVAEMLRRTTSAWRRRRAAVEQAQCDARPGDRHAYVSSCGALGAYALSRGEQLQSDTAAQLAVASAAHSCFAAKQCVQQPYSTRVVTLVTASFVFLVLWPQHFCAVCSAFVEPNPQTIGFTAARPGGSILFDNQLLDQHACLQVETGTSTQGALPSIACSCSSRTHACAGFYRMLANTVVPIPGVEGDRFAQPSSFSASQLSDAHWSYQYVQHGVYSHVLSVADLLPEYPRGAFAACPACSVLGYGSGRNKIIAFASDACFKLWNYAKNAGTCSGVLSYFRGAVHKEVLKQAGQPVDEDKASDCCPTEFRALSDKERAGVLGNVQANACMGISCCCHGFPGRGSAVFSTSERRTMYMLFMSTLRGSYDQILWGFDAACGIAQSTVSKYFPNVRKAVGYVHSNMHEQACMVKNGALFAVNIGRKVFEQVETLWAGLSHLIPIVRPMTTQHFHDTIEIWLLRKERWMSRNFVAILLGAWTLVILRSAVLAQKRMDLLAFAATSWNIAEPAILGSVGALVSRLSDMDRRAPTASSPLRQYIEYQYKATLGLELADPVAIALHLEMRSTMKRWASRSRDSARKALEKMRNLRGLITRSAVDNFEASPEYKLELSAYVTECAAQAAEALVGALVAARAVHDAVQATREGHRSSDRQISARNALVKAMARDLTFRRAVAHLAGAPSASEYTEEELERLATCRSGTAAGPDNAWLFGFAKVDAELERCREEKGELIEQARRSIVYFERTLNIVEGGCETWAAACAGLEQQLASHFSAGLAEQLRRKQSELLFLRQERERHSQLLRSARAEWTGSHRQRRAGRFSSWICPPLLDSVELRGSASAFDSDAAPGVENVDSDDEAAISIPQFEIEEGDVEGGYVEENVVDEHTDMEVDAGCSRW